MGFLSHSSRANVHQISSLSSITQETPRPFSNQDGGPQERNDHVQKKRKKKKNIGNIQTLNQSLWMLGDVEMGDPVVLSRCFNQWSSRLDGRGPMRKSPRIPPSPPSQRARRATRSAGTFNALGCLESLKRL